MCIADRLRPIRREHNVLKEGRFDRRNKRAFYQNQHMSLERDRRRPTMKQKAVTALETSSGGSRHPSAGYQDGRFSGRQNGSAALRGPSRPRV